MNLVTDPWIRTTGGNGTFSMSALFTYSDRLPDIFALTPQTHGALYRFLTSVVLAACGEGYDPERVISYLDAHEQAFDLFGDVRPFYQCAEIESRLFSVARLAPEFATGADSTHFAFNHTHEDDAFFCAQCLAHLLIALPAFSSVGGRGYGASPNGGSPMYFVPKGDTVADTLRLCSALPSGGERPAWEGGAVERGRVFAHLNYMEALTFQTRRVLLVRSEGLCSRCGGGGSGAINMYFTDGHRANFDKGSAWADPWVVQTKDGPLSAHLPKVGGVVARVEKAVNSGATLPVLVSEANRQGIQEFTVFGSACEPGKAKMIEWYSERIVFL